MKFLVYSLLLTTASCVGAQMRPDILVENFEGKNYGKWTVTGEAFGSAPAQGTLPNQMAVSGFRGHGLANSYVKGDGTVGTLTSPPFRIERNYLAFLIGGGKSPETTSIHLLSDGKVIRTATGPNDKQGGSERLNWQAWDVRDLKGKTVQIEIVDKATGGWGHISADEITIDLWGNRILPSFLGKLSS